jgi:hypothetical protein
MLLTCYKIYEISLCLENYMNKIRNWSDFKIWVGKNVACCTDETKGSRTTKKYPRRRHKKAQYRLDISKRLLPSFTIGIYSLTNHTLQYFRGQTSK